MLNSSSIHHTVNMKLLLLTSVICFAAALGAPADKQKRDILPGDPRYGTDHHHHHHHHEHEHENEVHITKAVGGYVGSFSVPDTEVHKDSFQVPNPTYGPPNYKPGKPIGGGEYLTPIENGKDSIQVPSTSYGIPDFNQINNNLLVSGVEDKHTSFIKEAPKTTVHTHTLNTDYQAPSAEAPITSYSLHDLKSEEPVHNPHTSYGTPILKTVVHEQPKLETVHLQKSVSVPDVHHVHTSQPVVHKHVETTSSISVPQVKVTTSHLPETQGIVQHSVSNSVPSFTSFGSSGILPSVYTSYPTSYAANYPTSYFGGYQSLNVAPASIPVKTVDRHVRVQVPQPYPVPVTKHVTYPVPVPHTVEVPRPYYVRVPQPVQVTVNRPYPVEVPRAVPYPVPHYIRTSVPVVQQQQQHHHHHLLHQPQQHHLVETVKATNPVQSFFDNTASGFQDTITNLPSFTNPLDNFQNPFENFQNPFENFQVPSLPSLPSLPSFPSFPSLPSLPSFNPTQPTQAPTAVAAGPAIHDHVDVSAPTGNDAVSIENPTINSPTTASQTIVESPLAAKTVQHTHHTVKTTTRKEYVQPTDENGGYIY